MKTKKGFRQKLKCFFSKSSEDQKRSLPKIKSLLRDLGLYSAGIFRIYLCWLDLLRLIMQRSTLDWGTLNLDGGKLTLDGGARPRYNLSTAWRLRGQGLEDFTSGNSFAG